MKVRNPKFRVRSALFDNFDVQSTATPSFNLNGNVQLGIKNANFGPYKYNNSTVYFYHGDTAVGSAVISKSKAQFRRTKKFNVAVNLTATNIAANSQLATDITNGTVPLTSRSTLTGKVELMLIFKKKKSVNMNCTMEINTSAKSLQNIVLEITSCLCLIVAVMI
ncbi:hypothetical protein C3L33_16392, partial [Rhododendron williamsianum]